MAGFHECHITAQGSEWLAPQRLRTIGHMTLNLFPDEPVVEPREQAIVAGATLLRGAALAQAVALLDAVEAVTRQSPLRHMSTPGGFRMSVAMTNCGAAGWITDRSGYRYGAQIGRAHV